MDDPGDQLRRYLLPGEVLLWAGRPDPHRHLSAGDLYLVPFSLVWCGFAVFWESAVATSDAPAPFLLFGGVFVVIGLYVVAGRFVLKARRKRRTAYGLTDRRALITLGADSLSELATERQPVHRRRSRGGKHLTVVFGRSAGGRSGGFGYANTGMDLFDMGGPVAFYDVSDVAGLEDALRLAGL
ncbi:PH domain-containing protein [Cellulomonas citrea]|uniref:PH domain-containing protein n=1 Tax=Cellulomonas citrea TaxID=1909423 RepID=UPI00135C2FCD|nr:PH domain-containing protein [Cellulomonas citrea]